MSTESDKLSKASLLAVVEAEHLPLEEVPAQASAGLAPEQLVAS